MFHFASWASGPEAQDDKFEELATQIEAVKKTVEERKVAAAKKTVEQDDRLQAVRWAVEAIDSKPDCTMLVDGVYWCNGPRAGFAEKSRDEVTVGDLVGEDSKVCMAVDLLETADALTPAPILDDSAESDFPMHYLCVEGEKVRRYHTAAGRPGTSALDELDSHSRCEIGQLVQFHKHKKGFKQNPGETTEAFDARRTMQLKEMDDIMADCGSLARPPRCGGFYAQTNAGYKDCCSYDTMRKYNERVCEYADELRRKQASRPSEMKQQEGRPGAPKFSTTIGVDRYPPP
jgi:hypothetical protein